MTPTQTPDCNRDARASFAGPSGSAPRICEWLYNFRGYGCSDAATWQAPCLMEDGSVKIWRLCDVHKQEVNKLMTKLAVPTTGWQPLPPNEKGQR